jgi:hypothetical protein
MDAAAAKDGRCFFTHTRRSPMEATGNDLVVIADNPQEMVEAQHATIAVVGGKLERAQSELADASQTLITLQESGLSTTAAERIMRSAESRVVFLEKAKQALEAGYVIVPEMPCDVVAIRVKRDNPKKQHEIGGNYTPSISLEKAPGLPAGEGQYVDPLPDSEIKKFRELKPQSQGGGEIVKTHRVTTGWDTDIELPVEFLKPAVVARTGKVMMRKLFDEVAVVGASSRYTSGRARKIDPMVVGSVIDGVNKRKLWFLVAWFVDTSEI